MDRKHRVRHRSGAAAGVAVMALSLAGCGGGGGPGAAGPSSSPPAPSSSSPPAAGYYLFYTAGAGGVAAIDPAKPQSPIPVDPAAADSPQAFFAGTVDKTTGTASAIHPGAVAYAAGGRLWKVSAAIGTAAPAPVQVSSETGATRLCGVSTANAMGDVDQSTISYRLPGPNGDCSAPSGALKTVRLGDGPAVAPATYPHDPVIEIRDPATGALLGWLATDGTTLNRYDAAFANPVLVVTFKTSVSEMLSTSQRTFLRIDDAVYVWDGTALSGPLYTSPARGNPLGLSVIGITNALRDATNLYFSDGPSLYRLPLDGSASAVAVVTEGGSAAARIDTLAATDGALVYTVVDGVLSRLQAVAKGGGTPVTLATASSGSLDIAATDAHRVYYNRAPASPTEAPAAGAIADTGASSSEITAAEWVGRSLGTALDPAKGLRYARLVLAEGYDGAQPGFGGGTLSSYDPAADTKVATLGTIPADIHFMSFVGYGQDLLGAGSSESNRDIFLLNTEKANSLQRVTNTPSVNEALIF